jgi:hypothetical protein
MRISNCGTFFCALALGVLGLIATDTGKLTRIRDLDLFNTHVECIDDQFLLVNGTKVLTFDKRIPIWKFDLSLSTDFSLATAGKLVFCDSQKSRLLVRAFSDVANMNLVREMSQADFAIGPNSKVNLRVSGTEVATYGNRLRTHLEFLAKRNQWMVDPASRLSNIYAKSVSLIHGTLSPSTSQPRTNLGFLAPQARRKYPRSINQAGLFAADFREMPLRFDDCML